MQLNVGDIVEGKVTGIKNYGAFVELAEGKSGMVFISEVAHTYVNDINDFLKLGDEVKVMVTAIAEDGKISLSIKRTTEPPEKVHLKVAQRVMVLRVSVSLIIHPRSRMALIPGCLKSKRRLRWMK